MAMRFGWTAYVVPFLFVISPSLLLLGDNNQQIAIDAGTALVGVYLISVAAIGYFRRPMNWLMRVLLILLGVAAMIPDQAVGFHGIGDILGCLLGILILTFEAVYRKKVGETASQ